MDKPRRAKGKFYAIVKPDEMSGVTCLKFKSKKIRGKRKGGRR